MTPQQTTLPFSPPPALQIPDRPYHQLPQNPPHRCRDCRHWIVRTGCVHTQLCQAQHASAIVPPQYQIYTHTRCAFFTRRLP